MGMVEQSNMNCSRDCGVPFNTSVMILKAASFSVEYHKAISLCLVMVYAGHHKRMCSSVSSISVQVEERHKPCLFLDQ